MSDTSTIPTVDPATVVADDSNGTGGIQDQRTAFDAYLNTRYPNETANGLPRPMILGATWPINSADVGLDNAEVWDPDDGIVIIVPLAADIVPGDRIELRVGRRTARGPISAQDVQNGYISTGAASRAIPEGRFDISYTLYHGDTASASRTLSVLALFGQPGHEGSGTPSELQAPTITTPASGHIGQREAAAGVEVTIPAYPRMRVFDTISLFWGDVVIDHEVQPREVGRPIVIRVDQATVRAAGDSDELPVYYFVTDEVGNESEWSADAVARVAVAELHFAAPSVIDPLQPDNAVATLNLDNSGSSGLQIKAGGFQPADKVTVKWRSTRENGMVDTLEFGPVDIASADEVVQLTLPRERLWNLAGGSGRGYYEVTRNGVITVSQSAHVNFVGTLTDTLPAPTIEGAQSVERGWWVDADLPFAYAVIPRSANLAHGDRVSLVMRGTTASGRPLVSSPRAHTVGSGQGENELRMRIDSARFLKPLEGGFVDMHYTIRRGSGQVESIRERFYIGYIQETLPAPTTEIDLSVSNNVLNPTLPAYTHGVYIDIPALLNVEPPYTLTLVWETSEGGYYEQELPVAARDEANTFQVPAEELRLNGNAVEVTVYYIISQENMPDRASADLEFTIATPDLLTPALQVSSATMYLRGGVVEMMQMQNNAWRVIAPRVSGVHARTQQRLPVGGRPPYRYQSSNANIAAVDGSGRVWPKRSGSIAVTITDSASNVVSYPVHVSYCFRVLVGQGNYNLLDAEKLVRTYRGTFVTGDALSDLHALYGYPLPLGRHTWTGQRVNYDVGCFYHMATKQPMLANTNNPTVRGAMMMQAV